MTIKLLHARLDRIQGLDLGDLRQRITRKRIEAVLQEYTSDELRELGGLLRPWAEGVSKNPVDEDALRQFLGKVAARRLAERARAEAASSTLPKGRGSATTFADRMDADGLHGDRDR